MDRAPLCPRQGAPVTVRRDTSDRGTAIVVPCGSGSEHWLSVNEAAELRDEISEAIGAPSAPHGQRIARLESALLEAAIALDAAGLVVGVYPGVYPLASRLREVIDGTGDGDPRVYDIRELEANLTAAEEQRDVYRDRCQQLSARVAELEDLHVAAARSVEALDGRVGELEAKCDRLKDQRNACSALALVRLEATAELTASLSQLITRIRRVGGYSTPEDQEALREAERLVAGTTS